MGEVKFWRYYIPPVDSIEGWGVFVLDSTGVFAAVTDYGNVAYKWTHHAEEDFRHFFAKGVSGGYLLQKLFYEHKRYDGDATLRDVKEYIIDCRRDGSYSREKAREEWDLLSYYDDLDNDASFVRWYDHTSLSDAGEFYNTSYPASAKAFVNKLIPRLSEAIREELAMESEQNE
ncbi:hypothetical protein M3661_29565 [Paenibacillus sp. MER 180]|uniref:hypothetical protein n=1 Tax=Paenibacillus sp. MER 180 TaxID=2939570 RepID=UPI002041DD2F|nr:hypothetical protein [Paenibacillus sp. MER 180]MCM3294238.1 hypothetical protein [Paenibacillus sp. MER 180]